MAVERATGPEGESERAGTFGNLFLEQGMRERMPEDAERRDLDPRGDRSPHGDVGGRRAPLVVVERDAAGHATPAPRAGDPTSSDVATFRTGRVDASLRRLRERMFRGVERTPAGVRLGLLLVVGLVAVTISQVEYSGVRAGRDRALRQAAAETRVVGELRHANSTLVGERDTARRDADAAAHALNDATTDLRRWRRIAAGPRAATISGSPSSMTGRRRTRDSPGYARRAARHAGGSRAPRRSRSPN